jgi:hypothetical protein
MMVDSQVEQTMIKRHRWREIIRVWYNLKQQASPPERTERRGREEDYDVMMRMIKKQKTSCSP